MQEYLDQKLFHFFYFTDLLLEVIDSMLNL